MTPPAGVQTREAQRAVRDFEGSLQRAVKLGILRAQPDPKSGEFEWDAPEAEGFRLPTPDHDWFFVVRVPALVRRPDARGMAPAVDFTTPVQEALIEAIVESAATLPIESEEWLTVVAKDASPTGTRSSRVYLVIKGSDVDRLRKHELSAAVARTLVRVTREF